MAMFGNLGRTKKTENCTKWPCPIGKIHVQKCCKAIFNIFCGFLWFILVYKGCSRQLPRVGHATRHSAIPPFRQSQFYVLTKANIRKHQPPAASFLRWAAVEICSNVEEIHEFTSLNWFISQRWCKTLEPLETKGVGPSASCPKFMPFQDEYFGRYLSKQRHELGNM